MKKQSYIFNFKNKNFKRLVLIMAVIVIGSGSNVYAHDNRDDLGPVTAMVKIRGCTPDSSIKGKAFLIEEPSAEGIKEVRISIKVRGLSPGKHAVHIHETGMCEPCGAAGGHFDPGPVGLSSPDGNHPYHSGDLINIEARGRKGRAILNAVTTRITLSPGPLSIFDEDGSAFIIHDNPDTYCPEGAEAGCAGGTRAACGIIELKSNDDDEGEDDDY
jgi:Cu-Zn family superoxide dismutase